MVLKDMSPINHVHQGMPPFLLIHGDADKTVPFEMSLAFQAKLKEKAVPCQIIQIKGAPHRIDDWPKFDGNYGQAMVNWLKETLR
jgi:alpha-L-fucosidase 2